MALFTAACGGQGSSESFDDEPGFVTATTEADADSTQQSAKETKSEIETPTETGTICLIGDGYQMNVLAANDATSCDVASDVFNQVTDGMHPGDDSVWDKSGSSVSVPGRGHRPADALRL